MASAGGRPRAVGISPQAGTAEVSAARAWAIRAVLATAVLALLAVFAASAHAAPAVSSGVSTQNGFPLWYQDAAGNRIEQCIDPADANCALVASDFFNPTLPIVFPSSGEACAAPVDPTKCNFPDEFFYASADSDRVQLPGCGALSPPGFALLRVALEGAFGTADGSPAPGQQLVFARTRVVVRGGLCPNTAYTFRTPFGNIPLTTDDTGGVRPNVGTTDIGCLAGTPCACDFHAALAGSLFGSVAQGGFLRSVPQPAGGYLGDGATLGPIAGGTNSNDFAVLDGSSAVVGSTTNFTGKTQFRGSTASLKVTERIRRIDDGTILYQATMEDPHTWARPWTIEYQMHKTNDPIFEYACHEGNYGMQNILRAQRKMEAEQAKKARETGTNQ